MSEPSSQIDRLNFIYEVEPKVPLFHLGKSINDVVEILYSLLSPISEIDPDKVSGLSGNALSEVGCRIGMFDGRTNIVISASKIRVDAREMQAYCDTETLVKIIEAVIAGVAANFPDYSPGKARLLWDTWVRFNNQEFVDQALANNTGLTPIEGEKIETTKGAKISNASEAYHATFLTERSILSPSGVYIRSFLDILPNSPHMSVRDTYSVSEKLTVRWLTSLNLIEPSREPKS